MQLGNNIITAINTVLDGHSNRIAVTHLSANREVELGREKKRHLVRVKAEVLIYD